MPSSHRFDRKSIVMAQAAEQQPISDFLKHELELDRKFAEHIKKLNESSTISYEDEAGYWVTRTPEGVITRIKQIRKNA